MPIEPKPDRQEGIPSDMLPHAEPPLRRPSLPYRDPTCPKCGITLGNKMAYACGNRRRQPKLY